MQEASQCLHELVLVNYAMSTAEIYNLACSSQFVHLPQGLHVSKKLGIEGGKRGIFVDCRESGHQVLRIKLKNRRKASVS